jgi:hypothetical protein
MKYSKVIVKEICKYIEDGMSNRDAAALSHIREDTFYEWMKKPEFLEAGRRRSYRDCRDDGNVSVRVSYYPGLVKCSAGQSSNR